MFRNFRNFRNCIYAAFSCENEFDPTKETEANKWTQVIKIMKKMIRKNSKVKVLILALHTH